MNELISFGEALKVCFSTTSYVIWLLLGIIVFSLGVYGLKKSYNNDGWSAGKNFILFLLLIILFTSFLYRPLSISSNTTKEQAERGVYIGW